MQAESSITVHLVNLTNPMLMRGAFREIYPTGPFQVRLNLPAGLRPGKARLLKSGQDAGYTEQDGWLIFSVPRVHDHEVIAIDTYQV
jgi:hypothetical protein